MYELEEKLVKSFADLYLYYCREFGQQYAPRLMTAAVDDFTEIVKEEALYEAENSDEYRAFVLASLEDYD